jgi:MFS family permease
VEAERSRLLTAAFIRVWLATFGAFATFGMLVLTLPLYAKDELNASSVGVGIAVGAGSITSIIFSPVSGRIADRRGRRLVFLAGGAGMVACYLALALNPGMAAVVAIRLVAGAAEATFVVGAYTVVVDIAPESRRGEAMSLVTLASYLGLTIGPVGADLILGGSRFALVWLVAAGLVVTSIAILATLPETRPQTDTAPSAGWLPPRAALRPGLLVLIAMAGFGGFAAFAALYARELGIGRPGLVFAVFGGTVVLVRAVGRKLPDAIGPQRMLAFSFMSLAAGLAMIGAWQSPAGLILGTIVFASGQALAYPSAVLLAMNAASTEERAAVVGSVGAFVDVALGLGAIILGGVVAVAGYGGAFLVASGIALSGLLVVASLRRPARIAGLDAAS